MNPFVFFLEIVYLFFFRGRNEAVDIAEEDEDFEDLELGFGSTASEFFKKIRVSFFCSS